ncbi:response regulator transcription factor [Devosia sp. XJ19-1]|uniref:winged helix family transcriptional regulator n=1 Tax=Devosia ureilytica TaxID=2952754 RepID=UPI0020C7BC70|nr:response regulator transcription factor [Devosia ureilytica]MCP8885401.1 response regulator transcription factor [Devosia ureilytica]
MGRETARQPHHAIASSVTWPCALYGFSIGESDRTAALAAGASDVFAAPLDLAKLKNSVIDLLRQSHPWGFEEQPIIGDIRLDRERFEVTRRGKNVHLTISAFKLLDLLMERAGKVVPREELLAAFSEKNTTSVRAVDVQINRLKRSLTVNGREPPIKSVRGQGYVLDP